MNNILTASRLNCLLRCMRMHYWRYEVGLVHETETLALRFGSAWARAMEARWKGADYGAALEAAVPEDIEFDEQTVATISGLLAGYFKRYGMAADDELVAKPHPEVEFNQPLAGSRTFSVAGKMDVLCQLRDGRLAIKEDKTTSDAIDPGSDYWLRLRFNLQLLQYVLAAKPMGWDVAVAWYDVTRKPSIRPSTVPLTDERGKKIVLDALGNRVMKANGEPRESGDQTKAYTLQTRTETPEEFNQRLFEDTLARPEFYFARREVPIIEQDLDEFVEQRLVLSRNILWFRQNEKRWPDKPERAWPRAVSELNCRNCAYASFCLQNLSVNPAQPPAGFKVGEANPELSQSPAS